MAEYYMFNKPSGCITARSDPRHKTVMDYFPQEKRDILHPIGRLDKDTEGLLLFTDDGTLTSKLLNPESSISKTYFFYALGTLSESERESIEQGIKLYPTRSLISRPATLSVEGVATLGDIKEHLSLADLK